MAVGWRRASDKHDGSTVLEGRNAGIETLIDTVRGLRVGR